LDYIARLPLTLACPQRIVANLWTCCEKHLLVIIMCGQMGMILYE